jgi:hypothetical protein
MPSGHRNEQYVRPESNVSRTTTRNPAAATVLRLKYLTADGIN